MGPYHSPSESPEPASHPKLQHDLFTAILLPCGAVAGLILLFAMFSTDRLIIPGLLSPDSGEEVRLFDVPIGSTVSIHENVWGACFAVILVGLGSAVGMLLGRLLGKIAHWRT